MHSTLLKAAVFLAHLFLVSARPQSQQTPAAPGQCPSGALEECLSDAVDESPSGAEDETPSAGNYLIDSCGSQATDVQDILSLTYLSLQPAMLSTDSAAYRAFFRTAAPSSMTAVLKEITAGPNITDTHNTHRPSLACVNRFEPLLRYYYDLCLAKEETVVIQPQGTPFIFLCPVFFSLPQLPQSTQCSTVNAADTALSPGTMVIISQYGFLVRVLAAMYIRQMKGRNRLSTSMADVQEENDCLALGPNRALKNPSSYAFYASSKWQPSKSLKFHSTGMLTRVTRQDVRAGCTDFPSKVYIQPDRELLAVDGGASSQNGTDSLSLDCIGISGNSTSCAP